MQPGTKILICSAILDDWGGSEELWALALPHLRQQGISVLLAKETINKQHPRIAALAAEGVRCFALRSEGLAGQLQRKYCRARYGQTGPYLAARLKRLLRRQKPAFVVISQGVNFDGLHYAAVCKNMGIPYGIVCQKGVDFFWPTERQRQEFVPVWQAARWCVFVSDHNLRLTEEQFGLRLPKALVLGNPVRYAIGALPFPKYDGVLRLACVGRLFVIDKGQDMLLRVLARRHWQHRSIEVHLYGTGPDEAGLSKMAALLGVAEHVFFHGQVEDVQSLWPRHHALILPSRSEGLPLVVQEAMAAGRPVIATHAGGVQELVTDGVEGFLAPANEDSLDAAMERAWQQRHRLQAMGLAACEKIKSLYPQPPEQVWATLVMNEVHENKTKRIRYHSHL